MKDKHHRFKQSCNDAGLPFNRITCVCIAKLIWQKESQPKPSKPTQVKNLNSHLFSWRQSQEHAQANQSNAFCGGRPRSHSRHQQLELVGLADGKQGPPARATAHCFGFATSGQTSKPSGWMPPSQMLQPLPWNKRSTCSCKHWWPIGHPWQFWGAPAKPLDSAWESKHHQLHPIWLQRAGLCQSQLSPSARCLPLWSPKSLASSNSPQCVWVCPLQAWTSPGECRQQWQGLVCGSVLRRHGRQWTPGQSLRLNIAHPHQNPAICYLSSV